eukprot:Skav207536  [mRNA]  locus=scaffold756:159389:160657:- [translate_table: standard]
MEVFKQAQDRWAETLILDEDLCDAVAFIGPDRHRVPFVRAQLATLSKPLKAALYGEFREGHTHELTLSDVTVDAFDVVMRTAYHLDPKLTPKRALYALQSAKLYMIEELAAYCVHYLQDLDNFDCGSILETLTESVKHSLLLPEEVLRTYWAHMLLHSSKVLESPFFVETHGSIIAGLIPLNEFNVHEQTLWDRLVQWSANAVQKPELLGPFAESSPCRVPKRIKLENCRGMQPDQVAQQQAILSLMTPHMRFTRMNRDFFVDRVRKFLDRQESDAVMDYFLLKRLPKDLPMERSAVTFKNELEELKGLVAHVSLDHPNLMKIGLEKPQRIIHVSLVFASALQETAVWYVSALGKTFHKATDVGCQSVMDFDFGDVCDEFVILLGKLPTRLVKVRVMGTTRRSEQLDRLVQKLSKDLPLPSA